MERLKTVDQKILLLCFKARNTATAEWKESTATATIAKYFLSLMILIITCLLLSTIFSTNTIKVELRWDDNTFSSARTGLGLPVRDMDTRATVAVEIVDQSKLSRGNPDTNIFLFCFLSGILCYCYCRV